MSFRLVLALVTFFYMPLIALAQEDGDDQDAEPVDPLAQCLEIGQMRYDRCVADLDSDQMICSDELSSYQAQCYALNSGTE